MATSKICVQVDEEIKQSATRYSLAAGHSSMSETWRELIEYGLYCKTEKPHASLVRQNVKDELDAFMATLDQRIMYHTLGLVGSLDDALSQTLSTHTRLLQAILSLAADTASLADETGRSSKDVRDAALTAAFLENIDPDDL